MNTTGSFSLFASMAAYLSFAHTSFQQLEEKTDTTSLPPPTKQLHLTLLCWWGFAGPSSLFRYREFRFPVVSPYPICVFVNPSASAISCRVLPCLRIAMISGSNTLMCGILSFHTIAPCRSFHPTTGGVFSQCPFLGLRSSKARDAFDLSIGLERKVLGAAFFFAKGFA